MNLVIVESPAKCKTIGNYLGSDSTITKFIIYLPILISLKDYTNIFFTCQIK